jgi:hypothetical protein
MDSETLLDSVIRLDPKAMTIYRDEQCEWVRCRLAIVGKIQLDRPEAYVAAQKLTSSLKKLTAHAYAVLDELSDEQLSFEDLWNLLLLIAVPWTRADIRKHADIADVLSTFATDVSGSRKVILWADTPLEQHLGSLGAGAKPWIPPSGDPLRDAVTGFARSDAEHDAFEVLFKRRIEDEDIDELIRVLGGKSKE